MSQHLVVNSFFLEGRTFISRTTSWNENVSKLKYNTQELMLDIPSCSVPEGTVFKLQLTTPKREDK